MGEDRTVKAKGLKERDHEHSEESAWCVGGGGGVVRTPPLLVSVGVPGGGRGGGEAGVGGGELVPPLSVSPTRPVSSSHILAHLISSPQCGG